MTKQSFRITIPRSALPLLALAKRVIQRNKKQGEKSVLTSIIDLAELDAVTKAIDEQHNLSLEHRRLAKLATKKRNQLIGKVRSKGSLLYFLTAIRDVLVGIHKGNEYELGNWGYNVKGPRTNNATSDEATQL